MGESPTLQLSNSPIHEDENRAWQSGQRQCSSARSAARSRRSGSPNAPPVGRGAPPPRGGAWDSLVEERPVEAAAGAGAHRYALAAGGGAAGARLYADIETSHHARLSTGIDEFDRVLGGGGAPRPPAALGR